MTFKANGGKIGEYHRIFYRLAICKNGRILKNTGSGWSRFLRTKAGVNPEAFYAKKLAEIERWKTERPAYSAFKEFLHEQFAFKDFAQIYTGLQRLSNDPDSLWSEFNNFLKIPVDVDTVVKLCQLYRAEREETAEWNLRKQEKKSS